MGVSNTMFIDGVIILVSLMMAIKSGIIHDKAELFIWVMMFLYGLVNLVERNLKGGRYDY